ncbi:hypothetical protein QJS10_CPB18g01841 [Acorus calamus]|uniref:Beta-glucuronosyltransferase GlcAT14A n=1 Tax=Acorus calamus TaxID=4465 RepID=A0AAV9CQ49_ACOCL|nr:hypothetical protein QJS10_CPB18g01841 [Acorus calamus]
MQAEKKSLYSISILTISLVSLLFILCFSFYLSSSSPSSAPRSTTLTFQTNLSSAPPPPPSFAYLLSGSDGDAPRLLRLLSALYHPRNRYLLHLDLSASHDQRLRLVSSIRSSFPSSSSNVAVIGRPGHSNPRGSSALSASLHGAAAALRLWPDWDWLVTLDASAYPIVTQDDLLHVFSYLPRDLNFVQHSSHIGWRESRRLKPIIVDPGLHLSARGLVFYATQRRDLPDAYKIFTGSDSVILSRKFTEFCIMGVDNLPRTLLMYYANTPAAHKNYFQTVICNSAQFNRSTINHNLHHVEWDNSSKVDPRMLGVDDLTNMTLGGAAFAMRFSTDDPVLDLIDQVVLHRGPGQFVPGGWCLGRGSGDPCRVWGDPDVLRPGPGARRLERAIVDLLSNGSFRNNQCIWE